MLFLLLTLLYILKLFTKRLQNTLNGRSKCRCYRWKHKKSRWNSFFGEFSFFKHFLRFFSRKRFIKQLMAFNQSLEGFFSILLPSEVCSQLFNGLLERIQKIWSFFSIYFLEYFFENPGSAPFFFKAMALARQERWGNSEKKRGRQLCFF